MTEDPLLTHLRHTVLAGGRLLTHLEGVSGRLRREEQGGADVELSMFYGQAFDNVIAVVTVPPYAPGVSVRVLHEAIQGRAVFRGWQKTHTPVDAPAQLGRMATHWARIVALVLVG